VNYKIFNNIKVLLTGGDGQLGKSINALKKKYLNLDFYFTDSNTLDITSKERIEHFFSNNSFDYIINCAAFTNVEIAEKEPEKAFLINAEGVKIIAEACQKYNVKLIHISTDYVFDGKKRTPYIETDIPNPINEYGKSKLLGEQYIQETLEKYFIIRTSWLYSQFGKNFYKTIIEKTQTEAELTITTSETGTPTNANDLAEFLLRLIYTKSEEYGIYHFSNLGMGSWYDFAHEIIKVSGNINIINLEKTDNYPTFAQRPKYSVLSKEKCLNHFDLNILDWKESMKNLIED